MKAKKPMNHLWKIADLPEIELNKRPKVILLGNGINRAFDEASWKRLIENSLSRNNTPYSYQDIEKLPATMQIVAACYNNTVKEEVKNLASNYVKKLKKDITAEQRLLLNSVMQLNADAILTTNYTLELEQAAARASSLHQFRKLQIRTKDMTEAEVNSRLYQCSEVSVSENKQRIWHIHGDISKPESIVIGHYYYGKLQSRIQERIRNLCRSYNIQKRKGMPFKPRSWVDYFMLGDVYALGIGLDSAEQDLWWLLACKQLEFPDTKLYYFEPEDHIEGTKKKMLVAYGANLCTEIRIIGDDYRQYYREVIEDIESRMAK